MGMTGDPKQRSNIPKVHLRAENVTARAVTLNAQVFGLRQLFFHSISIVVVGALNKQMNIFAHCSRTFNAPFGFEGAD